MSDIVRHMQQMLDVIEAAKMVTVIEERVSDGALVVGPVGWNKLVEALAYLRNG